MKLFSRALGSALASIVLGCGGRVAGSVSERALADGGVPELRLPDGGATNPVADGSSSEVTDGGAAEADGLAPSDWTLQPTVWVGEVEATVTYPEDTYSTGPQKVVLVLGAITGSAVVGTVTFGSGTPPPPPTGNTLVYPPAPVEVDGQSIAVSQINWVENPYSGYTYSLVSSTLQGNSLALAFAPSELWSRWCPLQDASVDPTQSPDGTGKGICSCEPGSCHVTGAPNRILDLVVDGREMQGQLLTMAGALSPNEAIVRLQRVK